MPSGSKTHALNFHDARMVVLRFYYVTITTNFKKQRLYIFLVFSLMKMSEDLYT